jgi:hypothetical protein
MEWMELVGWIVKLLAEKIALVRIVETFI